MRVVDGLKNSLLYELIQLSIDFGAECKWYSLSLQVDQCNIRVESELHRWTTVVTQRPVKNRSEFSEYVFARIMWLAGMLHSGATDVQWWEPIQIEQAWVLAFDDHQFQ